MNITRFNNTISAFDAMNAEDPNLIEVNGKRLPKELVYAQRMTDMLNRYAPQASEALQLAARCQHIQRWKSPRSAFPMTKSGYLQWRHQLKTFHAQVASQVLLAHGYEDDMIQQVCSLLKKENLAGNADTQTLEDVIVLAFLEHDLADFVQKHADYSEEKFITILRKSYLKMSENGRAAALRLITIPADLLPVVQKAIA
jgi:DNA repair ATPase RecN